MGTKKLPDIRERQDFTQFLTSNGMSSFAVNKYCSIVNVQGAYGLSTESLRLKIESLRAQRAVCGSYDRMTPNGRKYAVLSSYMTGLNAYHKFLGQAFKNRR